MWYNIKATLYNVVYIVTIPYNVVYSNHSVQCMLSCDSIAALTFSSLSQYLCFLTRFLNFLAVDVGSGRPSSAHALHRQLT